MARTSASTSSRTASPAVSGWRSGSCSGCGSAVVTGCLLVRLAAAGLQEIAGLVEWDTGVEVGAQTQPVVGDAERAPPLGAAVERRREVLAEIGRAHV